MKKILTYSALALILAGCTNTEEEKKINNKVEAEEKLETVEKIEEVQVNPQQQQANLNHYMQLQKLIRENGIVHNNFTFHEATEQSFGNLPVCFGGVVYAKLGDFNADNIEDLLVIYNELSELTYSSYTLNVYTYSDNEYKLLYEDHFDAGGQAEQSGISIVQDTNENSYIKIKESFGEGAETHPSHMIIDLTSEEVNYISYSADLEEGKYFIELDQVDEAVYTAAVQQYSNEIPLVLNDTSDGKEFAMDLTNPEESLQEFLTELLNGQQTFYTKANEIESISDSNIIEMKASLESVWYTQEINSDNKAKLIDEGYIYHVLEYDYENSDFIERDGLAFYKVSEDRLNEQLLKHFDTTVSPNEVPSSPPQSESYDEYGNYIYEPLTFYEDGYYYYNAAEYPGSIVRPISEITRVTHLKDNYYYVEYRNFSFNGMEYPGNTYEENFMHLPLKHWPSAAIGLLFEQEGKQASGAAVLKQNDDGTYAIRYLTENHFILDEYIEGL